MADADFGDLLDFYASDMTTTGVLLYIEHVTQARKFMSASRRVARIKPVVVIKAGRHEEGQRAAASHTGALAGSDAVYDAAFRRAGMLRVTTLTDLFDAVELLSTQQRVKGDRLAILTNGGGAGVLATDTLIDEGGHLAPLAPETIAALNAVLPKTWSHANPVDIIGDADGARYGAAAAAVLSDRTRTPCSSSTARRRWPTRRRARVRWRRWRRSRSLNSASPFSRCGSGATARRPRVRFSRRRVCRLSKRRTKASAPSCISRGTRRRKRC